MAKKETLSDWIISEEAQGYSEEELTKYLLNHNYSQEDIKKALNEAHPHYFSIVNFIKKIGIKQLLLFMFSAMFIIYLAPREGLSLFGILAIAIVFIEIFKKKVFMRNHKHLSNIIVVFISLSYLFVLIGMETYITIFSIILLLYSIYLFKKKIENALSRYLIFIISSYISVFLGGLISLIINYVLFIIKKPNLIILLLPYFFASFTFMFSISYFLKKLSNNVLNKPKAFNIIKTTVKSFCYSFILFFIILNLIGYLLFAISVNAIESFDNQLDQSLTGLKEDNIQRFENIMETNFNLSSQEIRSFPIINENGNLKTYDDINIESDHGYVSVELYKDDFRIYFDCDEILNCKSIIKKSNQKIEQVVSLQETDNIAFLTLSNNEIVMIIIPQRLLDKTYSLFEFEDEDLKKLEIAKEIDNKHSKLYEAIQNQKSNPDYPDSLAKWISYIINLKHFDSMLEKISFVTWVSLELTDITLGKESVIEEWRKVKDIYDLEYYENLAKAKYNRYYDIVNNLNKKEEIYTPSSNADLLQLYDEKKAKIIAPYLEKILKNKVYPLTNILKSIQTNFSKIPKNIDIMESSQSKFARYNYYVRKLIIFKGSDIRSVSSYEGCDTRDECIKQTASKHKLPKLCDKIYDNKLSCIEESINPYNSFYEFVDLKQKMIQNDQDTKLNRDYLELERNDKDIIYLGIKEFKDELYEIKIDSLSDDCQNIQFNYIKDQDIIDYKVVPIEIDVKNSQEKGLCLFTVHVSNRIIFDILNLTIKIE